MSRLADLYPEVDDRLRVVESAGIDAKHINFRGGALNGWHAVLRYTKPRGMSRALLEVVVEEIPSLASLVQKYLDEESDRPPGDEMAVDEQLRRAVKGIDAAGDRLQDPSIKQKLLATREMLGVVIEQIDTLAAYKGLHDELQRFQFTSTSWRKLKTAAANRDNAGRALLEAHLKRLEELRDDAPAWIEALPLASGLRPPEHEWLQDVTNAVVQFDAKLRAGIAEPLIASLEGLRELLGDVATHMDERIFFTARAIPLRALADTLRDIAAALATDDPAAAAVLDARSAILNLTSILLGRVIEHKIWQDADNRIQGLSILVEPSGDAIPPNVIRKWREVKSTMATLIQLDPSGRWRKAIEDCTRALELQLTRPRADTALVLAFEAYREEALQQFVQVDLSLKNDCKSLAQMQVPLNNILQELDHG